jgi:hypothetical protein
MKFIITLILIIIPTITYGQSNCPPFIGDAESGVVYKRSNKLSQFPFKCFSNKKKATKAGYLPNAPEKDFTGWWRVAVTPVMDTCNALEGSTVNLFLQVKESPMDVYAEICPTNHKFHGLRTSKDLVLSSTVSSSTNADHKCGQGGVEITTEMVLGVNKIGTANTATYRVKQRCLNPQVSANTCMQVWEGVAFHEKHTIWPTVPSDINKFPVGCGFALKTCSSCHGG